MDPTSGKLSCRRRSAPLLTALVASVLNQIAVAVIAVAVAVPLSIRPVSAQPSQVLPGLVVTAPQQPGRPAAPPPRAPPPAIAPSAQPAPTAAPARTAPAKSRSRAKRKAKPTARAAGATAVAAASDDAGSKSGGGIVLVVNGEPITGYDISQRARLLSVQSGMGAKVQDTFKRLAKSKAVAEQWKKEVQATIVAHQRSKTRDQIIAIIQQKQKVFVKKLQERAVASARATVLPVARRKAREELVEEVIKRQAAKRDGISPDEDGVKAMIKQIAGQNKMTPQQFAEHFGKMGIDFSTFQSRFRSQAAWHQAVRKKYGYLVNPNNRDIDKLVQGENAGEDQVQLTLHRVLIPIPPKLDQRSMTQRVAQAEQLQRQFRNCRSTSALASKIDGARFEALGTRRASSFGEPTRTMLLSAKQDEMIPPNVTTAGIELLAVCGRDVVKATEAKRNEKANELRQREFERLSRKYLRDLRAEAYIEER